MDSTQTRVIDGFTVVVSQLPALTSMLMSARIGKLLGGPLSKAMSTINVTELATADMAVVGAAVLNLFDTVTEPELEKLVRTFLASATLDGAPFLQVADVKLQGRVLTYYKILGFALEVNYQDFFVGLRGLGVKVKAAAAAKFSSPKS